MSQTSGVQIKRCWILIGILVFLLLMIPFPLHDEAGVTEKYEAALWSFQRDKVVLEQNVDGTDNHVKYYIVYRGRILVFPYAVHDKAHERYAQW